MPTRQPGVDAAADRLGQVARGHRLRGEAGAHAACGAGGQVDLAQNEDEDQAQPDKGDEGCLRHQVADVDRGKETRW